MLDPERLRAAYDTACGDLLAERTSDGHWVGELASSALSTATAISALALVAGHARDQGRDGQRDEATGDALLIERGIRWLAESQNDDGGWGDTDKSLSNIATTMLVRSAFHLAGAVEGNAELGSLLDRAEAYIAARGGVEGLRRRYGKDKTFAVPILTNAALAGLVSWSEVAPLPFELACLPQSWYRFARLPVVSYAIPALVAVGQAGYHHRPPRNPVARWVRRTVLRSSLEVVRRMQPASGGFLEATPLTSFVVMSLASIGQGAHPVATAGTRFLRDSVRADGAWPIDTNLATWVTTLSLNALGPVSTCGGVVSERDVWTEGCLDWLLACQEHEVHPFTGAAPGGWGWSDLSGSVPDADDTPGALLALARWPSTSGGVPRAALESAAKAGLEWLLGLQNRDGGWPTFCRGWGVLPFDRSGTDLTAHAIRALDAWRKTPATLDGLRFESAIERAFAYLAKTQRPDGSWVPLWFGNQHHPEEENPIYGTARVLLAYRDLNRLDEPAAQRGLEWLTTRKNADGGWGGAGDTEGLEGVSPVSTVEETSLAVEALLSADSQSRLQPAIVEGVSWLVRAVESGRHRETSPIGFYFAKLWYYERLYPLIFTVSALGRAVAQGVRSADAQALAAPLEES